MGAYKTARIEAEIGLFQALRIICCVWADQWVVTGDASALCFGRARLNACASLAIEGACWPRS